MKLNPQAIINAGSVGGGCSGGGIQIGTNVPSGIRNTHHFDNKEERDKYFETNFPELERLKTIIICGEELQLWKGETAQSPYDNTKWVDMTWVIQGEQGIPGEKGENGRGIARISAQLSDDDRNWTLEITYSDGTQESLVFPVPDVLANFVQRLNAIEVKWTTTIPVNNLGDAISPGRYPVGDETYGKPPMMANKGSADVYVVDNSVIQVVRSVDGGVYTRTRHNGDWSEWVTQRGDGEMGGGGLNGDQEAMLLSLGRRLPEVAPETEDLNTLTEQGRYCYFSGSAHRPNGSQTHGSVDVHTCKDHVLQIATSIEGVMYHRSQSKRDGNWTDWVQISDHTGGATIYAFPRVSSVFTTSQNLIEKTTPGTGRGLFYIPWKYIIHDNYGCTPHINTPEKQQDADYWWVCPKSGSYDMELLFDVSFIKTPQTIPPLFTLLVWHRSNDNEREIAKYQVALDVTQKNQKTKSLKLRLAHIPSGDKIRWQVSFNGGSWTQEDNSDVSLVPFRTMLMVDEAEYDTAKRIGYLAYNTWANFQSKTGIAVTVGEDDQHKARVNAVKWGSAIENVDKTPV